MNALLVRHTLRLQNGCFSNFGRQLVACRYRSTYQLAALLAEPACGGVELEVGKVARVLAGPLPDRLLPSLEGAWLERLQAVMARGQTPVLFNNPE